MALRDLNERTPETILEFQAAAEDRYWEAFALMTEGYHAAGIYLAGYVAEILLKSAYFALIGQPLTADVWPLLAPAWNVGCGYFPASFSPNNRDYHNLDFWARLLRERRRRTGSALPWHLEQEYLHHTRRLHLTWWVEMRYRHAQATPQDAEDVLEAVSWLRKHYALLSTP